MHELLKKEKLCLKIFGSDPYIDFSFWTKGVQNPNDGNKIWG